MQSNAPAYRYNKGFYKVSRALWQVAQCQKQSSHYSQSKTECAAIKVVATVASRAVTS